MPRPESGDVRPGISVNAISLTSVSPWEQSYVLVAVSLLAVNNMAELRLLGDVALKFSDEERCNDMIVIVDINQPCPL
jgi:hypothetical protein